MSSLKRVRQKRDRKPVIAIAYDGERTEAEYFDGWRRILGPRGLVLKPFCVRSGGNPRVAVDETCKKAATDKDYDRLWCVCDVDDASPADVAAAKKKASQRGIELILSVRCFEVWLALHWGRSAGPVQCEEDAVNLVRRHHAAYDASRKSLPFSLLLPRTADACTNAVWLKGQGHDNPWTDVHYLVALLRWRTIYHMCRRDEWAAAQAVGSYAGSSQDAADGFIHFSTAAQVVESAAKHRAGQDGLLLLAVEAAGLGEALKWEPSRGGQLFPHLYGPLPLRAVAAIHDLPLGGDGRHVFPPLED